MVVGITRLFHEIVKAGDKPNNSYFGMKCYVQSDILHSSLKPVPDLFLLVTYIDVTHLLVMMLLS